MKKLLIILSLFPVWSQAADWLTYDADRRVYWSSGAIYTRDEYHWFVENTGQPTRLFLNGVYQSSETGTYDLNLPEAWAIQPNANGVKVGVVDLPGSHANRMVQLIQLVAPGSSVTLYPVSRYYPDTFGPALYGAGQSNRIVVIATGWAQLEMQIEMAIHMNPNCVFICAAPDQPQDMDVVPDYPYSFYFPNVLGVNATDRNGELYWSGTGNYVVSAPGRNITADGQTYSSGTSYAAPIAAGCVALVVAKKPAKTSDFYVQHTLKWATPTPTINRINPVAMLTNLRVSER
jgi:subtilisin family serine protease